MTRAAGEERDPSRPLGLLDASCIGVNAVVGSGIFLFPGKLAALLGPASVLAFPLTGLLLLPVALCYAEASSRFDRAGGPAVYAREAFGEWAGFAIGWMCWVAMVFGWAAVANGVSAYLSDSWLLHKGVAASVIAALGVLNYRGVKLGAWTSNLLTAAKLVPLFLFVLIGLPKLRPELYAPFAPRGWAPVGPACFMAYWAFQGFETVPVPAGEVRSARKSVPLAVLGSMALASALYLLVQAVLVGVHPGLAGSKRPLAEAAAGLLGPAGGALMSAAAVVSMLGFNAGSALGGPRYLVALAQSGDIPPAFAATHARFGTPHRAVLTTSLLTLATAVLFDFKRLVDFTNVVVCAQYLATCAAVPLLRRRQGEGGFRLPGGWALPLAGAGATLWLGMQGGRAELAWAAAVLALGLSLKGLVTAQVPL